MLIGKALGIKMLIGFQMYAQGKIEGRPIKGLMGDILSNFSLN